MKGDGPLNRIVLTGKHLKLHACKEMEISGLSKIEDDEKSGPPHGGGIRGKCKVFTPAARKRMMTMLSKIDVSSDKPLFVTLTYGREWSRDYKDWKTHLTRFKKRLLRKFPDASGVWKLEPQKRGAPHYHILLYGVKFIDPDWLALAWAECTEDTSQGHIDAGTQCVAIESSNGVAYYASKYVAKVGDEDSLPDYWQNVGQWWGYLNKAKIPFAEEQVLVVSDDVAIAMSRFLKVKLQDFKYDQIVSRIEKEEYHVTKEQREEARAKSILDPWIQPTSLFVNTLDSFIDDFKNFYCGSLAREAMKKGFFIGKDKERVVKSLEDADAMIMGIKKQLLDGMVFAG